MRQYEVTISGLTALLMHWDNIEWADEMSAWKDDPKNKKLSRAGDDRTPAFRWLGSTYNDGQRITIPTENIARSLMEGGASVPVPGARGNKTFKAQTQSGMMVNGPDWPLLVAGREIPWSEINPLLAEHDFNVHKQTALRLGFELSVKRAAVGTSKHIRVRPKFREWAAVGTLSVWDDQITEQVLQDILHYSGTYKGLGDWRPGGKTPGPHGMFKADIRRID